MLPSCGQAEQSSSDQMPSLWLHAYVTTVIIINISIWRSDENAEKTSMLVPGMTASDRRWLMRAVIRESGLVCLCSWLEEVRIPTCGLSIADSMSWTRFPSESWSEETDRKEKSNYFFKNQLFSKYSAKHRETGTAGVTWGGRSYVESWLQSACTHPAVWLSFKVTFNDPKFLNMHFLQFLSALLTRRRGFQFQQAALSWYLEIYGS